MINKPAALAVGFCLTSSLTKRRLGAFVVNFVRAFASGFFVFAGVGFDIFGEAELAEVVVGQVFRSAGFGVVADDGGGLGDALDGLAGGGVMREGWVGHTLGVFEDLAWLIVVENHLVNISRHGIIIWKSKAGVK